MKKLLIFLGVLTFCCIIIFLVLFYFSNSIKTPQVIPTFSITNIFSGTIPKKQISNRTSITDEQKTFAVWISFNEYYDGLLCGQDKKSFSKKIEKVFENCCSIGVNTVFVQVRPFGDSIYPSKYFPWSNSVTGRFGESPNFDPLKIMVEKAKEKNLKIHAWINPFRLMKDNEIKKLPKTSVIKMLYDKRNENDYIKKIDNRWYLNPSSAEAKKLIIDGIAEIVQKYSVDGIQMDDYFYPSSDLKFDEYSFKMSKTNHTLSEWRKENVSNFILETNKKIKSINKNVLFGISPDGNIDKNYSTHFADVRLWCSKAGYIDYIIPQVYYGFKHQTLPFEKVANEWNNVVANNNVKLIFGLANYKVGNIDSFAGSACDEWKNSNDIIIRQIKFSKNLSNYSGVSFFSYRSMFDIKGNLLNESKLQTQKIKGNLE